MTLHCVVLHHVVLYYVIVQYYTLIATCTNLRLVLFREVWQKAAYLAISVSGNISITLKYRHGRHSIAITLVTRYKVN